MGIAALLLGLIAATLGLERPAAGTGTLLPPPPPKPRKVLGAVLFEDRFDDGKLDGWSPDRADTWVERSGMVRAQLPDERQQHSLLYAGAIEWTDYAVDFDVCGMRGVDKGVVVRVEEGSGIGVDLRGPGYQDILLHRKEWPMGRARVTNANGVWHHVRMEARGHRYRVWVDDALILDRVDKSGVRPRGRFALAAYTGGVGECLVYYDNVVVTAIGSDPAQDVSARSDTP